MTETFADLATFLKVQIHTDASLAREALADWVEGPEGDEMAAQPDSILIGGHLVRWSPRRVLDECEVKRKILALHCPTEPAYPGDELTYPNAANLCQHCGPGDNWQAEQEPFAALPCQHLRLLALPYADRDGYREEWRPDGD